MCGLLSRSLEDEVQSHTYIGGLVNRRNLLLGLASGIPLLAARRPWSTTQPQPVALTTDLDKQIQITCGSTAPIIWHHRQTELGLPGNVKILPGTMNQLAVNVTQLVNLLQSSGIAVQLNSILLGQGPTALFQFRNPSDNLCQTVQNKLKEFGVDLSTDRIRRLLTVSASDEEMLALIQYIGTGGSITTFLLEEAGLLYEEANRVAFQLSPPPFRSRRTMPNPLMLNPENRRKAEKVIAFIGLAAGVAGFTCYAASVATAATVGGASPVAVAACSTTAVLGLLTAVLRFSMAMA